MRFTGAHGRAQDMRRAANRLRWEVEAALPSPASGDEPFKAYERPSAVGEIAETMGILANIMRLLDERMPDEQRRVLTDDLRRSLLFYREYHEVGR